MSNASASLAFCADCNQKVTYKVDSRDIELTIRGTSFKYSEKFAVCAICGEEIYVPEINDANVAAREAAYTAAKKKPTPLFARLLAWYQRDRKNRVIAWQVITVIVVSVIGIVFYAQNKLHEEDVVANYVPDIYVSPVRYYQSGSLGNIFIYDLECRIINRSSVAIATTNNLLVALTSDTQCITEEYGKNIHLYPITIPHEIIYQDAQVGYKLAYQPAEFVSGTVELGSGEYNAYQLAVRGDILYEEGAAYDEQTESLISSGDGFAHLDLSEFRLVVTAATEEDRKELLENLFISVETQGSYNADSGELYVVPKDQNISEQVPLSQ